MDADDFNEVQALAKIRDVFGRPPLLPDEDEGGYNAVLAEVVRSLKPRDFVSCLWVRDFVDRIWDGFRYQRIKPAWIEANSLLSPSVSPDKAYNFEVSQLEAAIDAVEALRVFEALQESAETRRDRLLALIETRSRAPRVPVERNRAETLPPPSTR